MRLDHVPLLRTILSPLHSLGQMKADITERIGPSTKNKDTLACTDQM